MEEEFCRQNPDHKDCEDYNKREGEGALDEKRRIRQGAEDRARGIVHADRMHEGEDSDANIQSALAAFESGYPEELKSLHVKNLLDRAFANPDKEAALQIVLAGIPEEDETDRQVMSLLDRAKAALSSEEVEEIEAGAEINESNDQWYQRNLFEDLIKKWAK